MLTLLNTLILLAFLHFLSYFRKPRSSGQTPVHKQVIKIYKVNNLSIGEIVRSRVSGPFGASSEANRNGLKLEWEDPPQPAQNPVPQQRPRLRQQSSMAGGLGDIIQQLEALKRKEELANKEDLSPAIRSLQATLEKERRRHGDTERKLRKQSETAEQKITDEQEKMFTFVLKLEHRDQQISTDVIDKMETGRLRQVATQLVEKYNVRLLAIDCGLNVKMDIPKSQWPNVRNQVVQIETDLKQLLPDGVRRGVHWRDPEPCPATPTTPTDKRLESQHLFTTPKYSQFSAEIRGRQDADRFSTPIPVSDPHDRGQLEQSPEERFVTRPTDLSISHTPARKQPRLDKACSLTEDSVPEESREEHRYRLHIQSLKDKIKELEKVINMRTGAASHGGRKDEDRLITIQLPFSTNKGSPSEDIAAAASSLLKPETLAPVAQRLREELYLKLTGVFCPCSSGEAEDPGIRPVNQCPSFLLQTSMADLPTVKSRQQDLQSILQTLVQPEDPEESQEIVWQDISVGMRSESDKRLPSCCSPDA